MLAQSVADDGDRGRLQVPDCVHPEAIAVGHRDPELVALYQGAKDLVIRSVQRLEARDVTMHKLLRIRIVLNLAATTVPLRVLELDGPDAAVKLVLALIGLTPGTELIPLTRPRLALTVGI